MNPTGELVDLRRYPLKSARGERTDSARIECWGMLGDRHWALVDGAGVHPWLGQSPASLDISAEALGHGRIRLRYDGLDPIEVDPEECGTPIAVDFPGLDEALPAAEAANRWVSAALGASMRLIHLPIGSTREVTPAHGGLPGEVTSLAWDAPLHLIAQESLDELAAWIAQTCDQEGTDPDAVLPLDPVRFRPNLVVAGFAPFAEDTWTGVRIGEVDFRVSELCDRCAVTLYDPGTIARAKEPIRTLARRRSWDGKTWFGIRLVPLGTGELRRGDAVVLTQTGA